MNERLVNWAKGVVTGQTGHSGAIVPVGWGIYNAVWLAVETGFDVGRTSGTAVGTTWPLYLYGGAVGLTMLFAASITISRWRHPVEPRQRSVSTRGDAAIVAGLGILFGGLAVIFGSWWAPFSLAMFVLAIWLLVKDASARHRSPRRSSGSG
ncbi:MAG: hypothetical protein ACRDWE_09460 [Acidimicrobiales bacterium]